MTQAAIISAFTIGVLGSFHCIGMCGAIAFSLPLKEDNSWSRLLGGMLYNIGRITTYGILGAVFGILGQNLSLAGFQQGLSIALGILLLVALFFPKFLQKIKDNNSRFAQFQLWVRNQMGRLFKSGAVSALFGIGFLNGLLPCGLVYVAIAGAIATGNGLWGMFYMILFGLGTMPMMLLVSQFRSLISVSIRNKMRQVVPVFVGVMAVLFIIRGLNLGIPYLSPILQQEATSWILPPNCH